MKAIRVTAAKTTYAFRCKACGSEGELTLDRREGGPFQCPEKCGAVYVEVEHMGEPYLTCVVRPVFKG